LGAGFNIQRAEATTNRISFSPHIAYEIDGDDYGWGIQPWRVVAG
jgi:hypothetical protein